MCVIIVKKAGEQLPSKSFLKKAAIANRDGCGFATSSGVYFRSVFFEDFYRVFMEKARVEDDIVIHFRWATHGSVKTSNCHPFKGKGADGQPIFFAHNGVLPIASENDMTDSEIEFRKYILPVLRDEGGFTDLMKLYLEEEAEGSRFAFVNHDGLHLVGEFINYKGLLLSNTRFLGYSYYLTQRSTKREGKYAGVGL